MKKEELESELINFGFTLRDDRAGHTNIFRKGKRTGFVIYNNKLQINHGSEIGIYIDLSEVELFKYEDTPDSFILQQSNDKKGNVFFAHFFNS